MERTTISIPDHLRKRLRLIAAERGTSMATLIREALEEKVRQHRPKPRSIGMGDSGYTDTSQRVDELLEIPEWRSSQIQDRSMRHWIGEMRRMKHRGGSF